MPKEALATQKQWLFVKNKGGSGDTLQAEMKSMFCQRLAALNGKIIQWSNVVHLCTTLAWSRKNPRRTSKTVPTKLNKRNAESSFAAFHQPHPDVMQFVGKNNL